MTTTLVVPYTNFQYVATIALRCVGRDQLLPILTYVQFRAEGGRLTATATDRYTVARARADVPNLPDVEFYLSAPECRAILATFKGGRHAGVELQFDVEPGGQVAVSRKAGLLSMGGDATLRFAGMEGDWPKLDHLLDDTAKSTEEVRPARLNTKWLRRLPEDAQGAVMARQGLVHGFYADDWCVVIMAMREPSGTAADGVIAGWAA